MSGSSDLHWPFTPACLADIFDKDNLSVIESGCSERLGRPLTIMDFDPQAGNFIHRIESIREKLRYADFCGYLRDNRRVPGGDQVCKNCDLQQAKVSLREYHRTGDPFRVFHCHMQLTDVTHVVRIAGRPVAMVFTGQYSHTSGPEVIQRHIQKMDNNSSLRLNESNKSDLSMLAEKLSHMPEDIRSKLEQEVELIERIAEAEFQRLKREREQNFFDALRRIANVTKDIDHHKLKSKLCQALEMIGEFCQCKYVVFFSAERASDTVLRPFAWWGISADVKHLPHFNWSKARLLQEGFSLEQYDIAEGMDNARAGGTRGDNCQLLSDASCLLPISIGDRYRSALLLGPFTTNIDIRSERRFLIEAAQILGAFSRANMEVLFLEQDRKRWESTARLTNHQVKTGLTQIMTPIGQARYALGKGKIELQQVDDFLKQAEDRLLLLARATNGSLQGTILNVTADDLEIESYSLAMLVDNCASGFVGAAAKKGCELVIDNSILTLPYAEVDVPRLTIALANLIENAVKYAFSGSKIYIRSHVEITAKPNRFSAIIEIDDIGREIREEERERIFEMGERGSEVVLIKRYPGSGYGLWEANEIIKALEGEIRVKLTPTKIHRREGLATRVVFSVLLPLTHKKSGVDHGTPS